MARYFLTIEYDGTPFCGWQRQDNGLTVQEVLETAGEKFTGKKTPAYAAGRTDTGVHAIEMGAHIDLPREFDPHTVVGALNSHMRPHPVSALGAKRVNEKFHARFTCYGRSYLYRILDRRASAPLRANRVWHLTQHLDVQAMQKASQFLVGRHDFTAFRSAHCQAQSPIKSLDSISVNREDDEVRIRITAPSFLHNQVRSIAGTLVQVGIGRWPATQVQDVLQSKDRQRCGPVAPSCGLYFVEAFYPKADQTP